MKYFVFSFLCAFVLFHSSLEASENLEVGHPLVDVVENVQVLDTDIVGGAELSDQALLIIKESDFKTIIDLRTPEEGTEEERKKVEDLGMTYVNIPMASRVVSEDQVESLRKALADQEHPVFMHCRSGGRVQALWDEYQKV